MSWREIVKNGLWTQNPGLVQLLGLCPLLAVSNSTINAIGLGIATLGTLVICNTLVSSFKYFIRSEIRIPIYVTLIASIVTIIDLAMNAWLHELHLALGIFIPLIVTNCTIMARAEIFASRNSVALSMLDGFAMGAGFLLVLLVLGGMRELIGQGTLLANAHILFGEQARDWELTVRPAYDGFLIAVLPPGAFFSLALLLAIYNWLNLRTQQVAENSSNNTEAIITE